MNKLLSSIAVSAFIMSAHAAMTQDLGSGKKLYADNCLRCHGTKGQGGVGKKLAGDAAYWDFAVFKRTVVEGIDDENKRMKVMPVFGKVGLFNPKGKIPSDSDLHDVQNYLKTFGSAE